MPAYSGSVPIQTTPRAWSRFVALGDSFSEGLCDDLGPDGRHVGWADLVARELAARRPDAPFRYANLAVRGRLAPQVVEEQVPAALAMEPDLASLAVGVNDTLRRRFDLDRSATAIESGVRALRGSGCDVLLFAFGDPSRRSKVMGVIRERILRLNSAVDAIADHYGCYVVHFWDVAAMDDDRLWADDRLHLSPTGHALAAECALEALGVAGPAWRTPLVPDARPSMRRRSAADLAWTRAHLVPWLARRARGESSGDGVAPKHPDWVSPRDGRWIAAP